jgi:hypothetical protein
MKLMPLAAAMLVAACAAPQPTVLPDPLAPPPKAVEAPLKPVLVNAGFEGGLAASNACPERWACSVHADGSSFRFSTDASTFAEGRQSLLIERVGKEPWAIVTQSFRAHSLRGQRIRYSIAVRTQDVDGEGAGAWLLVNGDEVMLEHQVRRVLGTKDWQRHVIEVVVPARADTLSVGATLEGGGRAWFDDARIEVLGPAAAR